MAKGKPWFYMWLWIYFRYKLTLHVYSCDDLVLNNCHCMMYKKCFALFNSTKHQKISTDVLSKVFSQDLKYVCSECKQWVCKTCDSALTRGIIPLQTKANGLQLQPIPPRPELSSLTALELRLISLRILFAIKWEQELISSWLKQPIRFYCVAIKVGNIKGYWFDCPEVDFDSDEQKLIHHWCVVDKSIIYICNCVCFSCIFFVVIVIFVSF